MARLVKTRLWAWSFGAGVSVRVGGHAVLLELERRIMDIDAFDETVIYERGGDVTVLTRDVVQETERPFLLRVGWQMPVR